MLEKLKSIFAQNNNVSGKEITSIESSYYHPYIDLLNGYNPSELVSKKGLEIYDEIRRDEQVKASMGTKKYAILSTGWDMHAAGEEPEYQKHRDFIYDNFTTWMKGSFNNTLLELCTFMDYGFVVAEKNYIHEDNVVYLDNIKVRAPHSFKITPDEHGNITNDSIVQRQKGIEVPLPLNKAILYTYQGEFSNPFGRSDYLEIYRSWFIKNQLNKFEAIYLEKFGTPSIIAKHEGLDETQRKKLIEVFQRLRNASVATIPKKVDYEIINIVKGGQSAFKDALLRHDAAISKGILMPNQLGFNETETGSNAKSKTQFDVFLWVVDAIRKDIEETIVDEQMTKQLINFNFGEQDKYPKFKFNPMTEKDLVPIFELWNKLVEKGSVKATKADEDHIRKSIEFPERDEDSELLLPEIEEEDELDEEGNIIPKEEDNEDALPKGEKEEMAKSDFPITKDMKQVNFKKINDTLEEEEDFLYNQVDDIIERMAVDTIDRVENKQIVTKKKIDDVDKFNIKYVGDIKLAFKKGFRKIYNFGISEWKNEQKQEQGFELLPEEYINWLNSQAFLVAGQMGDDYKNAVKQTLLNAINGGWSEAKTASHLSQQFARVKAAGATKSPVFTEARIRTIIRTNLNNSFNKGRFLQTLDLAKKSKSPVYRLFSEVLSGQDKNSHPFSKVIHGKYVLAGSDTSARMQYPFHFNERGIDTTIDNAVQDVPKDKILASVPSTAGYPGLIGTITS